MSEPIVYKPLATEKRRRDFIYHQKTRVGNLAIYEQISRNPAVTTSSFELIRIRRHNGFKIGDNVIAPAETYPTANMWGSYGWTYESYPVAIERLNEKLVASGNDAIVVEDAAELQDIVQDAVEEAVEETV